MQLVQTRLETQLIIPSYISFPVRKGITRIKEIPLELPDYCERTIQGLVDTFKWKIAKPLLEAENPEEEFKRLRNSFAPLRLSINGYIFYIWAVYPREKQKYFTEGAEEFANMVEERGKVLLGEEALETLLGVQRLSMHLTKDYLELWEHLDLSQSILPLYEIATDFDLCFSSIIFPLIGELKVAEREKLQNLQILVSWAKKYILKYAFEFSQFLKTQLSMPGNAEFCKKFYTNKTAEFVGSGPEGVYEALMEERQKERALENG
ncbi:MAG: hypothetical protein COS87_01835 [Chloroflexi bacterium CG07_land_8_20_14_0_80_45_17]|nr:MAG: hypothetical protein COX14_01955 [Chloroflexi bacterium CG23_combo_of_CG06-09_8_20_14_all_45_10]PIU56555.1 MAG: hypothetical protein COS87_01835 [Chloroflexi bacterium CG07_land_8_20_14_0_80_45_17]